METSQMEWRDAETMASGPSLEFIRAVAELLETDAEDILAELGYVSAAEMPLLVSNG